ncbi:MAG: class I SAM-dependent rRNA methyltransferase [Oligoflexia bacterium]|nr:class I SAM-dependent rRNA methyltransferase [Oligoflexia bacterium]
MASGYRGGRGQRGAARNKSGSARRRSPSTGPSTGSPRRHLDADQVQVNGYSEGWLRRGFPWVYRDEIVAGADARRSGEVVQIIAGDGAVLGAGLWGDAGKIAVRIWRRDGGPVDETLVVSLLTAARERRLGGALPPETSAWRWVHGENDDMPGLRVDVWGEHLTVSLADPSLDALLPSVLSALQALARPQAIWRAQRPPADGAVDELEGARDACGLLAGDAGGEPGQLQGEFEVEVRERGLRFGVRPGLGHDVGLFCDMRDVRAWLQPQLAGRRVLNLFAHTGAFSVLAAASGAARVVTVDLSQRALDRAQANMARNQLDSAPHAWLAEDSLVVLDRLRRQGQRFDLVIADPPSFSHGPRGDWSVERDLHRLVAACCRVLSPAGWLLVASNHGGLSPKDFAGLVLKGSLKAGVPLRLLHEGSTPVDFPAALSFPESRYLKCWVLGR